MKTSHNKTKTRPRNLLDELAKTLNIPRSTIYHYAKERRIPCGKIGNRYVIPDDIEERLKALAYENWRPLDEKLRYTGNVNTSSIVAQSVRSKDALKGDECAGEVHRIWKPVQSVSEAAAAMFGRGSASSTVAIERRRTKNVWLSPRQFAQRFCVGTSAVYGAVERGELPAVRLGRHIRIPPDAVERLLCNVTRES